MAARSIPAYIRLVPARRAPKPSAWARLVQAVRAHHTRRLLAEMDDRMLADIGVNRAQAQTEASRPAWDTACRSW